MGGVSAELRKPHCQVFGPQGKGLREGSSKPEKAHLASTLATCQPTTHPTLPVSHRTGENVQTPFIGVHPAPGTVLSTLYGALILTAILYSPY